MSTRAKVILIMAFLIVVFIYVSANYGAIIDTGYAKSTPKVVGTDCPDGHVCFWAVQKTTGNIMCRANTNDAWWWKDDPPEPCGDNDKPKTPKITKETDPPNVPTKTAKQPTSTALPTATKKAPATATQKSYYDDSSTDKVLKDYTATPSATCTLMPNQDDDCDICKVQQTMAAALETIAAEIAKP